MSTSSSFSGHLVGITAPLWGEFSLSMRPFSLHGELTHRYAGHVKPFTALASKIVQERSDILVTVLVLGDYIVRAEKEIDRYFPDHSEESSRRNIRVISIGGEGLNPFSLFPLLVKSFGSTYRKLANLQPVLCATGKSYDTPLKPTLVIGDCLFPEIILDIRKVSENGSHITILGWNPGNATAVLRITAPEKYGGFGDVETKARELAAATGRDVAEIENELFYPSTGAVIQVAGMPPIFDYESCPQENPFQEFQRTLWKDSYRFMILCDGMVCPTSFRFELEAHETWAKWFSETNRPYYALGPLQPQGFQRGALADSTRQNDLTSSQNGQELVEFLDNTLKTSGSNSLIYISWGTGFWPKNEQVWKLIDILLDLKFPFILAHAAPMAIIPADVSARVKASGSGMLSTWTPQQLILAHPATGWFLTHCGQNSVMEALSQGIPMIAWPVDADQPINAVRLSLTLDVAFELVEIRTKHVSKPLYRGVIPAGTDDAVASEFHEVLKNARGPVGDRKRRNAHALRDAMMDAWGPEGDATKALRKLLNDNFP